uniref:Uncharacterized protein TCIL3000_11_7610 n=1 Tax=Trypanosoma congolense (strain IL3000) TaxID=1068625 RepID=G0V102_TRYCI|nr:unnamed protein product [Trypanosoma congolense IL3000]
MSNPRRCSLSTLSLPARTDVETAPAQLPVYPLVREVQGQQWQRLDSVPSIEMGDKSENEMSWCTADEVRDSAELPLSGNSYILPVPNHDGEVKWPHALYGDDALMDLSAMLPGAMALDMSDSADSATPPASSFSPSGDGCELPGSGSTVASSETALKSGCKLPVLSQTGGMVTKHALRSQWIEGTMILNEYLLLKCIGKGSSGVVKLAYSLARNETVAIKIVPRPKEKRAAIGGGCHSATKRMEALHREIKVMKKLRHRNIVALYEVIDDPEAEKLYIVMQHVDNGPIAFLAKDGTCDPVSPSELTGYARQILAGMEYLQRHGIVHRDIKPENILVSSNKCAFISDFGVAAILGGVDENCLHRFEGTPLFMPPEVFCDVDAISPNAPAGGNVYTTPKGATLTEDVKVSSRSRHPFATDVWSLGVTFYTLLVGSVPFSTIRDIQNTVQTSVKIPDSVPEPWRLILKSMLSASPEQRPTIAELRLRVKAMMRLDQRNSNQLSSLLPSSISGPGKSGVPPTPLWLDARRSPALPLTLSSGQRRSCEETPKTCGHVVSAMPELNFESCDSLPSCGNVKLLPAFAGQKRLEGGSEEEGAESEFVPRVFSQ